MKATLEYLNRDRRVSDAFIQRLENAGLEIEYGDYSYWNMQEYVQIGRSRVWLVETTHKGDLR